MMASCGTQQQLTNIQKNKYKELTRDVCIENKHEVRLAQALYFHMLRSND